MARVHGRAVGRLEFLVDAAGVEVGAVVVVVGPWALRVRTADSSLDGAVATLAAADAEDQKN